MIIIIASLVATIQTQDNPLSHITGGGGVAWSSSSFTERKGLHGTPEYGGPKTLVDPHSPSDLGTMGSP